MPNPTNFNTEDSQLWQIDTIKRLEIIYPAIRHQLNYGTSGLLNIVIICIKDLKNKKI